MYQIIRFSRFPQTHFGGASHEEIVEALFARDESRVISAIKSHLLNFYGVEKDLPQDFFDTL